MVKELKPCPWCGDVAVLQRGLDIVTDLTREQVWFVECEMTRLSFADPFLGRTHVVVGPKRETPQLAAEAWNERKVS